MLSRVSVSGFRALVHLEVPLQPLTVLVGQNDTGKSSFLKALNGLIGPSSFGPADLRRFGAEESVKVIGWYEGGGDGFYERTFHQRTGMQARGSFDGIGRSRLFALPAAGVSTICNGSGSPQAPDLDSDGGNLADVLDFFLRNDRRRFDLIEAAIRDKVPGVENVNIPTVGNPGQRSIDLVIDSGFRVPADQASAGVRLMLFFNTLTYHPTPPKLILIEEPENGVHPRRLADVVRLLREITEGKHGKPAQIILSTHSPYLLDNVDPRTDQVLVFRRSDDGARTAEAVDADRLKAFLDEFMLGEVWFNQGEEGLVARRT
jgi:predicted ATPase